MNEITLFLTILQNKNIHELNEFKSKQLLLWCYFTLV